MARKKERTAITLAPAIYGRVKQDAAENGFSVSAWIQTILLLHYRGMDAMGKLTDLKSMFDELSQMPMTQTQLHELEQQAEQTDTPFVSKQQNRKPRSSHGKKAEPRA